MSRPKSSGHVELAGIFQYMQSQMLSQLAAGDFLEQPTSCGSVSEQHWLDLFSQYLPQRYAASPAFVVDADGRRSRQIDVAIYDRLYSPLLFPHSSGLHIPAESVYAVFEVKQILTARWIRDAGMKAASVRALRRTSVPVLAAGAAKPAIRPHRILAGILAPNAGWTDLRRALPSVLDRLAPDESLDFGCALRHGAFELQPNRRIQFSLPAESLIFLVIRLLERLRAMGTAPAADLMAYARSLQSFRTPPNC
ncbi:MAG: DUF6602 domain-containing protein [Bryobacteraceae bacterium]